MTHFFGSYHRWKLDSEIETDGRNDLKSNQQDLHCHVSLLCVFRLGPNFVSFIQLSLLTLNGLAYLVHLGFKFLLLAVVAGLGWSFWCTGDDEHQQI